MLAIRFISVSTVFYVYVNMFQHPKECVDPDVIKLANVGLLLGHCCFNYWQLYRYIYRILWLRIAPTKLIIHFYHWIYFCFIHPILFFVRWPSSSCFYLRQRNPFTIFSSGNFIDSIFLDSKTTITTTSTTTFNVDEGK